jgi:hypothetical protein
MSITLRECRLGHRGSGTALTAAATASLLQGTAATRAKYSFEPGFWNIHKAVRILASGIISCAVTTPGTAKFQVQLGGSVVVFDSGAIPLNIVAKSNVSWFLDLMLHGNAEGDGTTTTLFPGACSFASEAVVGSPLPSAGGSGQILLPYNTQPVVGTGFDGTVQQKFDLLFTQTVATGSVQLHTLLIEAMN